MSKNLLEQAGNLFLTGPAGVGKTYTINEYVKKHKNVLLCASTGTAAINIGGSTAHRLFSIPVPACGGNPEKVIPSKLSIFANADTVIIEEISMLRNDAFAFAVQVIKRAEKLYGKKIKLIVAGDFSQLPPIVTKKDGDLLQRYGFDRSGFAFTAKEWAECKFKTVQLDKIYRQTDKVFIENLHKARIGDISCIPYFNQFVKPSTEDTDIVLTGTNAEAERINTEYLNTLNAPSTAYLAEKSGITGKELPCDNIVLLKPDCKAMFTANDTMLDANGNFNKDFGNTGRFQNGTMCTVVSLDKDSVTVQLKTSEEITIGQHKWSVYNYTTDHATMTLKKKEIGFVKQIPLKVAKAITIHKSQGKTLTNVAISPQIFADGQIYVALSRVTSPDRLALTEPITSESLRLNQKVQKFYNGKYTFNISKAQLKKQIEIEKKHKKKPATKKSKPKKAIVKKSTKRTVRKKASTNTAVKSVPHVQKKREKHEAHR